MNKKYDRKELSEEEIDNLVISQANNNAAWEAPIKVKKTGETKLALSKELAARAAFFANLHRETSLNDWLERVIKERIDLEEAAFVGLKRELAAKNLRA